MADQKGRIVFNNRILEQHEYMTVAKLVEYGYEIEVIPPSFEKGIKSADIRMNGRIWEIKSPIGKGKWVIKNIMQKASHQSENVIIDLRRLRQYPQEKYIREAEQRFDSITRLRHLIIISNDGLIIKNK